MESTSKKRSAGKDTQDDPPPKKTKVQQGNSCFAIGDIYIGCAPAKGERRWAKHRFCGAASWEKEKNTQKKKVWNILGRNPDSKVVGDFINVPLHSKHLIKIKTDSTAVRSVHLGMSITDESFETLYLIVNKHTLVEYWNSEKSGWEEEAGQEMLTQVSIRASEFGSCSWFEGDESIQVAEGKKCWRLRICSNEDKDRRSENDWINIFIQPARQQHLLDDVATFCKKVITSSQSLDISEKKLEDLKNEQEDFWSKNIPKGFNTTHFEGLAKLVAHQWIETGNIPEEPRSDAILSLFVSPSDSRKALINLWTKATKAWEELTIKGAGTERDRDVVQDVLNHFCQVHKGESNNRYYLCQVRYTKTKEKGQTNEGGFEEYISILVKRHKNMVEENIKKEVIDLFNAHNELNILSKTDGQAISTRGKWAEATVTVFNHEKICAQIRESKLDGNQRLIFSAGLAICKKGNEDTSKWQWTFDTATINREARNAEKSRNARGKAKEIEKFFQDKLKPIRDVVRVHDRTLKKMQEDLKAMSKAMSKAIKDASAEKLLSTKFPNLSPNVQQENARTILTRIDQTYNWNKMDKWNRWSAEIEAFNMRIAKYNDMEKKARE